MTCSDEMPARRRPKATYAGVSLHAYRAEDCEYVPLFGSECDARLRDGPEMVSANFVIPYPPGFPIMVPGQVLTQETIDFMRKLDVKEIHGYERARGLKLLRPEMVAARRNRTSYTLRSSTCKPSSRSLPSIRTSCSSLRSGFRFGSVGKP